MLFTPANEPKISNSTEVQDAVRGFKVGKAPGPNGIPNRTFKCRLPPRRVIQSCISIPVLPANLETRPRVFRPENKERSADALVLSTPRLKSVREHLTLQNSLRNKRKWATAR